MPEVIVNVSDAALASSTAGAIPVSRGPSAVPLYDTRFSWDATALQHTLTGQAASAGGDRWRLQNPSGLALARWDADGALQQDINVNTSGFTAKITPPNTGPPITFNSMVGTNSNVPGGNGLGNSIWEMGWNLSQSGPVNLLHPTFRIGMESNYLVPQTGQQVMEGHLFGAMLPGGPAELRTYSIYVDKNDAVDVQHKSQGTNWIWTTPYLAQQLMWLNQQATGSVTWRIESDSSINGYPLQLASVNGTDTTDVLTLGRNTSNNTQFTMTGKGSTRWDLKAVNGGVTQGATLINDGSNFSMIGTPNGGGIWNRTYGSWTVANGNSSQLYIQVDSNGGTGLGLGGNARNVGLGGTSWADGIGVIAIKNCITPPSLNPSGGWILWGDSSALKIRGPLGTVTTLALA